MSTESFIPNGSDAYYVRVKEIEDLVREKTELNTWISQNAEASSIEEAREKLRKIEKDLSLLRNTVGPVIPNIDTSKPENLN